MNAPSRQALRAAWRDLAVRNGWALVEDEEAFLRAAGETLASLGAGATAHTLPVLRRAYSALLYERFCADDGRAAQEILTALRRFALLRGHPPDEAEDLAQETIARLLPLRSRIEAPQAFLTYASRVLWTAARDGRRLSAQQEAWPEDNDGIPVELPSSEDTAGEVEADLLRAEIAQALQAALPNELQRTVMLRIVLQGDHPRDVAHALGLPLHQARIAKSRALQRLRADPPFLALLMSIAGEAWGEDTPVERALNADPTDTRGG